VRKAAHVTEYAILALLAARALRTSGLAALRRSWLPASFVFVAAVALVDEYHQSLLPSRTGTIYDSLLDMTGGAAALACLALWLAVRRRVRR
jgi:VanZ family protein